MSLDQKKSDAFADRLVDTLNAGAICLMTSIGHRTWEMDWAPCGDARRPSLS